MTVNLHYVVWYFDIFEVYVFLIVKGIQWWDTKAIGSVLYGRNYILQDSIFENPGFWKISIICTPNNVPENKLCNFESKFNMERSDCRLKLYKIRYSTNFYITQTPIKLQFNMN
jgi:hypothetical protein